MTTYVLVHGGGHGGWCWQRITPMLRSAGHEVYTPTLTGLGERSHLLGPAIDLDTHITDVVNVLHYEDLRDIVLVGHSYGGMVITGVADRVSGRVGHLVYLDASVPLDGESLAAVAPGPMDAAHAGAKVVDGVELVLFPGTDPLSFYGVTDADDIEWMKPKLTPHPWKCFSQPIRLVNEAATKDIPRTMINCTSTLRMRPPERVHRVLTGERVWEIDTGHDLMITEPKVVADMLLRVASA
ncbi:MAG: alpha/beta hydrolase [Acidimicrobiaceae bacterium]|nr:alpha/beta hydrolase [Acidimicrobiaceae bacterium]